MHDPYPRPRKRWLLAVITSASALLAAFAAWAQDYLAALWVVVAGCFIWVGLRRYDRSPRPAHRRVAVLIALLYLGLTLVRFWVQVAR